MKIQIFPLYVLVTIAYINECHGQEVELSSNPVDQWENSNVNLTCSYQGNLNFKGAYVYWTLSNPKYGTKEFYLNDNCEISSAEFANSSLYLYSYTNSLIHSITLKNITSEIHTEKWKCKFSLGVLSRESQVLSIRVKVPVRRSSVSPKNTMIAVPEHSTIVWQCKSSECRPQPKFRWFLESPYENSTQVLDKNPNEIASDVIQAYTSNFSFILNRTWNRWFLSCGANNKDDSTFVLSAKIQLNVTYPPDGPPTIRNFEGGNKVVSTVNVIIGGFVNLACSVSGGNPLPRLKWSLNDESPLIVSGILVTKNISFQATIPDEKIELKCQSIHDLIETSIVSVNVLYPPETPVITVKTSSGSYVQVNTTLDVIEGIPYTVNCSAKSNPQVSLFKWNDLPPSSSSILFVDKADHGHAESVSCNVSNVMQISDTRPVVIGKNITQLKVNVLYPPKVNILRDSTVIEGEEINYTCNFTQGYPSATYISWSWKGSLWDGQHLQLRNVSRNQAGIYRCSVHNIMAASDGRRELGNSNGTFNLSIQYKTKIIKFIVNDHEGNQVSFSENDTVNISCEIDGDPFPTGELLHQRDCCNLYEIPLTFTASRQSPNLRLSSVLQAQCSDTGVQTCTGSNTFYNGWQSASNKSISLFVNCSPRKHSSFEVKENVTSAINATATFYFTAMAYPPPNFQWYHQLNAVATSEAIGGDIENINISTNVVQIKFTLENVQESHYGEYLLNLTNQYGLFQQRFYLIPEELQLTETQTTSKVVGPAVGGTIGGLLAVITVIVSLVIVRKRKTSKRTSAQSKAIDLNDLHTYQNFQNDGQSSSESSNSALYERLHHADNTEPDQQYQQLATFTETDAPNQKLYENLKLSQLNKENNFGESSGSSQNTSAHNQRPV